MIKIIKCKLNETGLPQHFKLPKSCKLLDCQNQRGDIVFWVEIDQCEDKKEEHAFYVVPTGSDFVKPPGAEYFKTVQVNLFVWHIYHKIHGEI
jgi:hypothetical protein